MMMESRTPLRRLLLVILRPRKPSLPRRRPSSIRNNSLYQTRPQLPFLCSPLYKNHQFRYLTTERKRWLKYELFLAVKYTVYGWAIVAFAYLGYYAVHQEWLERRYPTPDEWRFLTRVRYRLAKWAPDRTDLLEPDWVRTGSFAEDVLKRLEDKDIDGAGLQPLTEGGMWIDGIGESGYDITAKSEPWRRGYYQILMLSAKAAEHLDNHVVDKKSGVVFPVENVWGPSNPNPKPIAFGMPSAPHEKDCEPAYDAPEVFYMRILTTRGFSSKQKMDAALEYASWLDYKSTPDAAERMYECALSLATEHMSPASLPYDTQTLVLRDKAPLPPSTNLLTSLTALATHKARSGDVSTALPVLLSVLRARRALPSAEPATSLSTHATDEQDAPSAIAWTWSNFIGVAKRLILPPAYPSPPDDGESAPIRDAKELCEEAGLNLYIGEIIYAARSGSSGREDGLAWTREAVDIAEEQLHKLGGASNSTNDDNEAEEKCRECLSTGLGNWRTMVARLAREENEKRQDSTSSSASSWLGFWGEGKHDSSVGGVGRWTAEEKVVLERMRRAQEVLDELEPPKTGFGALFWA